MSNSSQVGLQMPNVWRTIFALLFFLSNQIYLNDRKISALADVCTLVSDCFRLQVISSWALLCWVDLKVHGVDLMTYMYRVPVRRHWLSMQAFCKCTEKRRNVMELRFQKYSRDTNGLGNKVKTVKCIDDCRMCCRFPPRCSRLDAVVPGYILHTSAHTVWLCDRDVNTACRMSCCGMRYIR